MHTEKDLQKYRQMIEGALAELGRDDVGVGNVAEPSEGILSILFSRGAHQHTADIPIEKLGSHEDAIRTLRRALVALSKEVAQEAIGQS